MRNSCVVFLSLLVLLSLNIVSCSYTSTSSVKLTSEANSIPSATIKSVANTTPISIPIPTKNKITTIEPSGQILLPANTMSKEEADSAVLNLLRDNGNCAGRCVAGISPDEMTVQDAVNKMVKWGNVKVTENSQGKTFINIEQTPLNGHVIVRLSVGTWIEKFRSIDKVYLYISAPPENPFIDNDLWLDNQSELKGYQLDSLLKTYGIPSYIGFFFRTSVDVGTPPDERSIIYGLDLHYEKMNLVVGVGALAYYDGEKVLLCPSKDPRQLGVEINPEQPLSKRQDVYPVTWQMLTETDLNTFYNMFTTSPDACITTTLAQILILQPSFR